MFGNLYLKAKEERPILERHNRNRGLSIPSMENNVSKNAKVSCTYRHVHGVPSNLAH